MDISIISIGIHLIDEIIGDGKKRLPNVHDLPLISVSAEQCAANLSCVICQTDYEENELVRELFCKHYFHTACLQPWFKNHNDCPTCRMVVRLKRCQRFQTFRGYRIRKPGSKYIRAMNLTYYTSFVRKQRERELENVDAVSQVEAVGNKNSVRTAQRGSEEQIQKCVEKIVKESGEKNVQEIGYDDAQESVANNRLAAGIPEKVAVQVEEHIERDAEKDAKVSAERKDEKFEQVSAREDWTEKIRSQQNCQIL